MHPVTAATVFVALVVGGITLENTAEAVGWTAAIIVGVTVIGRAIRSVWRGWRAGRENVAEMLHLARTVAREFEDNPATGRPHEDTTRDRLENLSAEMTRIQGEVAGKRQLAEDNSRRLDELGSGLAENTSRLEELGRRLADLFASVGSLADLKDVLLAVEATERRERSVQHPPAEGDTP